MRSPPFILLRWRGWHVVAASSRRRARQGKNARNVCTQRVRVAVPLCRSRAGSLAVRLALLFAPVGAFLRYEFSNHLNGRRKDFFVGTYCANLFACVLDSVAYGLRDGASNGSAEVTMVMSALGTGVGGCCSTVSTFMTDTIKLVPAQKRDLPKEAFSYVAITMSTCCAISMAIYQATKIHSS